MIMYSTQFFRTKKTLETICQDQTLKKNINLILRRLDKVSQIMVVQTGDESSGSESVKTHLKQTNPRKSSTTFVPPTTIPPSLKPAAPPPRWTLTVSPWNWWWNHQPSSWGPSNPYPLGGSLGWGVNLKISLEKNRKDFFVQIKFGHIFKFVFYFNFEKTFWKKNEHGIKKNLLEKRVEFWFQPSLKLT